MIIIFIYKENFFYSYILGKSLEEINQALIDKQDSYYTVKIPKKGGVRLLNCIKDQSFLYELQTSLKNNFLNKIPISENAYGFVKEQSYKNFLTPHIWENNKKRYYLRIDIKDFFNSIDSHILSDVFKYYFKTDEKVAKESIKLLIEIITLDNVLPQGGVTSPVVSNIVFRQLDLRIQKYCNKFGFVYSRYADDLLFSSTNKRIHDAFFIKMISNILNSLKFKINTSKIKTSDSEISLNGFVVGQNIRVSRSKKRDINRVLFIYEDLKPTSLNDFLKLLNSKTFKNRIKTNGKYFFNKQNLINYLNGYRSFLISWLPESRNSAEFKKNKKYINRLEKTIVEINNLN